MTNFLDLADFYHQKIFQQLTTAELFDLITKQAKPDQPIDIPVNINPSEPKGSIKSFYRMVLCELFKRRGAEASRYQNRLLGSWLRHWSTAKKLSFIENNQDKKDWLYLLNAALQDPHSSLEHKFRCCLLINKLFPDTQDITPRIIQSMIFLLDVSKKISIAEKLKVYAWQFTETDIQLRVAYLTEQLNNNDLSVCFAAAQFMGETAPYASKTQCDAMITSLLAELNNTSSNISKRTVAVSLCAILPYASATQRDAMITSLLSTLNNNKSSGMLDAVADTLGAIAPYAVKTQCDTMITSLLTQLNIDSEDIRKKVAAAVGTIASYASETDTLITFLLTKLNDANPQVRKTAAQIMGAIAAHVSKPQCDALATSLLTKLNDHTGYGVYVNLDVMAALAAIAPYASEPQRDTLITSLRTKFEHDTDPVILVAVAASLGAISPHASKTQCNTMITSLLIKSNSIAADVRQAVATALGAIAPYTSKPPSDVMLDPLLTRLNDAKWFVRQAVATALGAIAPHASEPQRDTMITLLLPKLNDDSWAVRQAIATTLGAIAPHATETQCNKMILHVLSNLKDDYWSSRCAAVAALGAIAPYASQTHRDAMITSLLTTLKNETDADVLEAVVAALNAIASKPQRDAMITLLMNKSNDKNSDVYKAVVVALSALTPYLSEPQLKSLHELPGPHNFEEMNLLLIVQTRLHINQINNPVPVWHPEKDSGVHFSRNKGGMLSQVRCDREAKPLGEPRTMRLWSEAGNKRRAADDCMTDVSNKKKNLRE
ncbi:MAG: HEAT repeat domain-containing protein [Gammaproteobacteria bacterium]